MTTVNELSKANTISAGDLLPVWVGSETDVRRVSITVMARLLKQLMGIPDSISFNTQYVAPSENFSLTLTSNGINIWLIMTPTVAIAEGTMILPAVSTCLHDQEIIVNCTQQITLFTIDGNGSNIVGMPTTLNADDSFRLRFDSVTKTWYRINYVSGSSSPSASGLVAESSGPITAFVSEEAGTTETVMLTIPIAVGANGFVRISPVFSVGNVEPVTIRIRLEGVEVASFVIAPVVNPVSTVVVAIQPYDSSWASTVFSILGDGISANIMGASGDITGLVSGNLTITGQRSVANADSIAVGYYMIEKQVGVVAP